MKFIVSTKKITVVLILAVLFLTFTSLAAQFFMYMWGREGFLALLPLFDVGEDANIPTWYSSFQLLLCSALLATVAAAKKRHRHRYTFHWGVLSIIFLLLSIDEVATIHEHAAEVVDSLLEAVGFTSPGGLLYATWVIPGTAFVLIVALAYLPFLAHLPRKTLILFLVSGTLFVLGALGFEMLSARLVSSYGWEVVIPDTTIRVTIAVQTAIEELLEMMSIVVFIYMLLSYLSSYLKEVIVQISDDGG